MVDNGASQQADPTALTSDLLGSRGAQLSAALKRVLGAREALEAARAAHEDARDAAQREMRRLGGALVAVDERAPVELLRELYWDYPEVRVNEIARSFGMKHPADVSRLVGPDDRELPCRGGCGRTLVRNKRSRSDLLDKARPASTDPLRCPECQQEAARKEQERRALLDRWQQYHQVEDERLERQFEEALATGVTPSATYVEFPGLPGTWRLEGDCRPERAD